MTSRHTRHVRRARLLAASPSGVRSCELGALGVSVRAGRLTDERFTLPLLVEVVVSGHARTAWNGAGAVHVRDVPPTFELSQTQSSAAESQMSRECIECVLAQPTTVPRSATIVHGAW